MAWDSVLSLAYTAEQLVMAVQALTSDWIAPEHALALVSGNYLPAVLEHSVRLPVNVVRALSVISNSADRLTRFELAGRLSAVLEEVNALLGDYYQGMQVPLAA